MPPQRQSPRNPIHAARRILRRRLRHLLQPDSRSTAFLKRDALLKRKAGSKLEGANSAPPFDLLRKRQQGSNVIGIIPTGYSQTKDSPQPSTVAGIILGTVAGILFILFLFWLAFGRQQAAVVEEVVEVRERRSRSHRHRSSHREEEVIEKSRSRSPIPPPPQSHTVTHETIIVEEERRSVSPPRMVREEDEIIEVIEEGSITPPRRHKSRKKRDGTVRYVDPDEYGGGPGRPQQVFRSGRDR